MIGLVMGLALAGVPVDKDLEERTVYSRTVTVHASGKEERTDAGSLWVKTEKGMAYIDLVALKDSLGNRYSQMMSAGQEEEDGPVVYTTRVVREGPPILMSEAERWAAYVGDHPDPKNRRYADEATFLEQIRSNAKTPEYDLITGPEVDAFLRCEEDCGTMEVVAVLHDEIPLRLPHATGDLAEVAPDLALEVAAERLITLEIHRTRIEEAQADLFDGLETFDDSDGWSDWLVNHAHVEVTPEALAWLAKQSDIASLTREYPIEPHTNTGIEIREGYQIQQFLDNNLNGELGSGRSTFNDIVIAVGDTSIDQNHPAWDECENCSSRLRATDCWNAAALTWQGTACFSSNATGSRRHHGTLVAGQATAHLQQNQDGNQGSTWEGQRTGMSTESHLVFVQALRASTSGPGAGGSRAAQRAMTYGADIYNASYGSTVVDCMFITRPGDAHAISAFNDGMFFVASAGNEGNNGGCTTTSPASSPGAFTVAALSKTQAIRTANPASYSSRGLDYHGRNLVDVAAIGGRQSSTLPAHNDNYGGGSVFWVGTSFAAPVVTGAAANYKHQLVNKFGASAANAPGVMNAHMMLMVDHDNWLSGIDGDTELDPVLGGGRLRMRKFNNAGMDAPWELHSWRGEIEDGELIDLGVRTGATRVFGSTSSTSNTPVSSDVDLLSVAGFWLETNSDLFEDPADIGLELQFNGAPEVSSQTDSPGQLRIRNTDIGGKRGTLRLRGLSIPTITGLNNQDRRMMNVAWFFEDSDRDDSNGPPASIQ